MNAYTHSLHIAALVCRARLYLDGARESIANGRLCRARMHIATARALWTRACAAIRACMLRHTYVRVTHGWRAVVMIGDSVLWISARTYAHRQSAQRAAHREVRSYAP
jgi:hypothetical protein